MVILEELAFDVHLDEHQVSLIMSLFAVRWGLFIMAITIAQVCLMVIHTVNAVIVFSIFTCSADHTYAY